MTSGLSINQRVNVGIRFDTDILILFYESWSSLNTFFANVSSDTKKNTFFEKVAADTDTFQISCHCCDPKYSNKKLCPSYKGILGEKEGTATIKFYSSSK